ncbi:hypothetical protein COP1_023490 [Malus domestica]
MSEAVKVFDEFPQPDVFLWTSMVTGYEQNGDPEEALEFFSRIMMAGSVKTAARLFMKMPEKDVVSWSSIIACYVHSGDVTEALNLFNDMIDMRIEPNSVTLVSALQACALAGNLEEGKKIHDIATRKCFELDIKVATALIDMYMKCSAPEKAGVLFNRMPKKDVVSWAALLSGRGLVCDRKVDPALERGVVERSAVVVVAGVDSILKIVGIVWREIAFSRSGFWVKVQDLKNMRTGSSWSSSSSSNACNSSDSNAIGVVLNDPPETVTNASHGVGFDLNVVASVEEEESVGATEIDHVHPVLEGAEQGAHAVLEERNMTQDSDPLDLLPFD